MTTPIDDPMFTLAIPLRVATTPATMIIPTAQRRPSDTDTKIKLPAGMHTMQLLWQGGTTTIDLRLEDGSTNGRVLTVLPLKVDATPVISSLAIPPGGAYIYFVQRSPITAEQASATKDALGVTVFLNEARKPLT